VIPNKN